MTARSGGVTIVRTFVAQWVRFPHGSSDSVAKWEGKGSSKILIRRVQIRPESSYSCGKYASMLHILPRFTASAIVDSRGFGPALHYFFSTNRDFCIYIIIMNRR